MKKEKKSENTVHMTYANGSSVQHSHLDRNYGKMNEQTKKKQHKIGMTTIHKCTCVLDTLWQMYAVRLLFVRDNAPNEIIYNALNEQNNDS